MLASASVKLLLLGIAAATAAAADEAPLSPAAADLASSFFKSSVPTTASASQLLEKMRDKLAELDTKPSDADAQQLAEVLRRLVDSDDVNDKRCDKQHLDQMIELMHVVNWWCVTKYQKENVVLQLKTCKPAWNAQISDAINVLDKGQRSDMSLLLDFMMQLPDKHAPPKPYDTKALKQVIAHPLPHKLLEYLKFASNKHELDAQQSFEAAYQKHLLEPCRSVCSSLGPLFEWHEQPIDSFETRALFARSLKAQQNDNILEWATIKGVCCTLVRTAQVPQANGKDYYMNNLWRAHQKQTIDGAPPVSSKRELEEFELYA